MICFQWFTRSPPGTNPWRKSCRIMTSNYQLGDLASNPPGMNYTTSMPILACQIFHCLCLSGFLLLLPSLVCNYCDYIKTWCDSSCSRYLMFGFGYLNSLICNKECKFTKEHLWPISFTEEEERYPSFWLYPAILDHVLKKSAAPNMSVAPVSGLGSFPASLGLTLRKAGGGGGGDRVNLVMYLRPIDSTKLFTRDYDEKDFVFSVSFVSSYSFLSHCKGNDATPDPYCNQA